MKTEIDWSKARLILFFCFFYLAGCDAQPRAGERVEGSSEAGSDVRVVRDGNVACYTFWRSISCVAVK